MSLDLLNSSVLLCTRLDRLDQKIARVKRLKAMTGDSDPYGVVHGERHQRHAREWFSKGHLKMALAAICSAERYASMGIREATYFGKLIGSIHSMLHETRKG